MTNPLSRKALLISATVALVAFGAFYSCTTSSGANESVLVGNAASKVYVAPGKYDEFYSFMSGGFNGQVRRTAFRPAACSRSSRLLAERRERLGLQRRDEADAADDATASFRGTTRTTRAVADRRRARRTLALHQRQQHAARRAHRPHAFETTRSSRSRTPPAATPRRSRRRTRSTSSRPRASACRSRTPTCRSTATSRTSRARCRSSRPTSRARWTSRSRS